MIRLPLVVVNPLGWNLFFSAFLFVALILPSWTMPGPSRIPSRRSSESFECSGKKLTMLHFQDFDKGILHGEPTLVKVLNGFPAVGSMRKGWRLVMNNVLPAAFLYFCNINDEHISSGKRPSKIYVTFEDVVQRIADWRNIPFFNAFTLQKRLRCKTQAPAALARRHPFCFAPQNDIFLDPHSPTVL